MEIGSRIANSAVSTERAIALGASCLIRRATVEASQALLILSIQVGALGTAKFTAILVEIIVIALVAEWNL